MESANSAHSKNIRSFLQEPTYLNVDTRLALAGSKITRLDYAARARAVCF